MIIGGQAVAHKIPGVRYIGFGSDFDLCF